MPDLLLLAPRLPYPPDQRDRLRAYHMLRFLSREYRVHLACFFDPRSDRLHLAKLKALCHETCFVAQVPFAARARSLRALVGADPLGLHYYRDATLGAWVQRLLRRQPVTHALAMSAPMAQYLMEAQSVHRVVDLAGFEVPPQLPSCWPLAPVWRREQAALLAYQRALAARFEGISCSSPGAAQRIRQLAPESGHRLACIGNGVDADYFSPHIVYRNPFEPGCIALVRTGALDDPVGAKACAWFARAVFAPLYARHPELRFYIVGAHAPAGVRALALQPGVVLTGAVPDIRPYLAHAALAVAPRAHPPALQNKVLEAMAMQKLIVASIEAVETLGAPACAALMAAADADQYITHIESALAASNQRRAHGLAARARLIATAGAPASRHCCRCSIRPSR